jgi:hypothetical protein
MNEIEMIDRIERLEQITSQLYVYLRDIYKVLYHESCDREEFMAAEGRFESIHKNYMDLLDFSDEFPSLERGKI